jgi:hypothetical protein
MLFRVFWGAPFGALFFLFHTLPLEAMETCPYEIYNIHKSPFLLLDLALESEILNLLAQRALNLLPELMDTSFQGPVCKDK